MRALFLRYASHHEARACGVGLPRHKWRRIGQIEHVCDLGDGLRLRGWTTAASVSVHWHDGSVDVLPDQPRPDVKRRRGGTGQVGFEVTLPKSAHGIRVDVPVSGQTSKQVEVPHPAEPRTPRIQRRMQRAFARDMLRALPAFLSFALRRDAAARHAIKSALGLIDQPLAPLLEPSWYGKAAQKEAPVSPFTIILPVFNGFDVLEETLDRVARNTSADWNIIVIDDASPDPRVASLLRDWVAARSDRAQLCTFPRNQGFVAAVNHGLALAEDQNPDRHVVLLNSDAHVPPGWDARLLAPLSDETVASVTPFSNNAEIFSAPLAGGSLEMSGAVTDHIDTVAQGLNACEDLPDAPTGVGFCMALSRRWLMQVPRFDPAFGRGYGEEVDWCQCVRALGGRHVGQPRLFVRHVGGESFGGEKPKRVAAANAKIAGRYPNYDADVQAFLRNDPLRTPRFALALAWVSATIKGALPVYLGHSLGGGAELALQREVKRDLQTVGAALILRVGGARRFTLELQTTFGRLDGAMPDLALLRKMLAPVPQLRIVYSCGVGDSAAHDVPGLLLGLRRDPLADRLEARLHDYFPISPSYCLLGSGGRYRAAADMPFLDPMHHYRDRNGATVTNAEWQRRWGLFLQACDEITVFSRASASILAQAYPRLAHRFSHRPATKAPLPARVNVATGANGFGVLGNLNTQKGAQIIAGLARRLDETGDTRSISVIGNVDAAIPMPGRVTIHGGYNRDRIADLTQRYGISTWIVPAIWPETYSFTTREALATGLPVISFDLGAQGEAVRAAPNGRVVPYAPDADLVEALWAALPKLSDPVPARAFSAPVKMRQTATS